MNIFIRFYSLLNALLTCYESEVNCQEVDCHRSDVQLLFLQ